MTQARGNHSILDWWCGEGKIGAHARDASKGKLRRFMTDWMFECIGAMILLIIIMYLAFRDYIMHLFEF